MSSFGLRRLLPAIGLGLLVSAIGAYVAVSAAGRDAAWVVAGFRELCGTTFTYATASPRITATSEAVFAVCTISAPRGFDNRFDIRFRRHGDVAWRVARLRGPARRFFSNARGDNCFGSATEPVLIADHRERLHLLFPANVARDAAGRPRQFRPEGHNLRHFVLGTEGLKDGTLAVREVVVPASLQPGGTSFEARKLTAAFSRRDRQVLLAAQVFCHTGRSDGLSGLRVARFDATTDTWQSFVPVPRLVGDPDARDTVHGYAAIAADPRSGALWLVYTYYVSTPRGDGPYRLVRVSRAARGAFAAPVEVCRARGSTGGCYPVDATVGSDGVFHVLFNVTNGASVRSQGGRSLSVGFHLASSDTGFRARPVVGDDGLRPAEVAANLIERGGAIDVFAPIDGGLGRWRSRDRGESWRRIGLITRPFAGRRGAYNPMALQPRSFASSAVDRLLATRPIVLVTDLDRIAGTMMRQRLVQLVLEEP